MKLLILIVFIFGCSSTGKNNIKSNEKNMVIENLIKNDNYASSNWEKRGLNPSNSEIIELLNKTTIQFLNELKKVDENSDLNKEQKSSKIMDLVDNLPWDDLDTEEKEFLADVLSPAIESLGFEPFMYF